MRILRHSGFDGGNMLSLTKKVRSESHGIRAENRPSEGTASAEHAIKLSPSQEDLAQHILFAPACLAFATLALLGAACAPLGHSASTQKATERFEVPEESWPALLDAVFRQETTERLRVTPPGGPARELESLSFTCDLRSPIFAAFGSAAPEPGDWEARYQLSCDMGRGRPFACDLRVDGTCTGAYSDSRGTSGGCTPSTASVPWLGASAVALQNGVVPFKNWGIAGTSGPKVWLEKQGSTYPQLVHDIAMGATATARRSSHRHELGAFVSGNVSSAGVDAENDSLAGVCNLVAELEVQAGTASTTAGAETPASNGEDPPAESPVSTPAGAGEGTAEGGFSCSGLPLMTTTFHACLHLTSSETPTRLSAAATTLENHKVYQSDGSGKGFIETEATDPEMVVVLTGTGLENIRVVSGAQTPVPMSKPLPVSAFTEPFEPGGDRCPAETRVTLPAGPGAAVLELTTTGPAKFAFEMVPRDEC